MKPAAGQKTETSIIIGVNIRLPIINMGSRAAIKILLFISVINIIPNTRSIK